MTAEPNAKQRGAYYTPRDVVETLVRWAVRSEAELMLDPSCGDGRFLACHRNSIGVEQDEQACRAAQAGAEHAEIICDDFFTWAARQEKRFDCAAGNPPFIRYQRFKGDLRTRALTLCARLGVRFSALASSWAPFLVVTASLLRRGGRMSFVVPAEIGHAPYATPLLDYCVENFARVQVVAYREKLFGNLSEDCWLLHAEGHGGSASHLHFSALDRFSPMRAPPTDALAISVSDWRRGWNRRLRPFLLPPAAREAYAAVAGDSKALRLGDCASVGIGYVTGDNDFFHLRPSKADALGIPSSVLLPSVRNTRLLPNDSLTPATVETWRSADQPILLLNLPKTSTLPKPVARYLESEAGTLARASYKCRNRDPWYSVPDVSVPDLFLTYMSGRRPNLVENIAGCTCPNTLHAVRLKPGNSTIALKAAWRHPFTALSCELEGHPLGGGMLKLEPREAAQVVLGRPHALKVMPQDQIVEAVGIMQRWRHLAA